MLPVIQDLLPTSPYLRRQATGELITIAQMRAWNTFLSNLNSSSSMILPLLSTLSGSGSQTPDQYTVTTPSWLDTALGNWSDGKPVSDSVATGDGTITTSRATIDGASISVLTKNHGQIISSKESIDRILTSLGIPHSAADITEGGITKLIPGVIFLIRSPATLTVSLGSEKFDAEGGIIFLPNPASSPYLATIKGTGSGTYHFDILQMSSNNSQWNEYVNTITDGTEETFTVSVGNSTPVLLPVSNQTLKQSANEIMVLLAGLPSSPEILKIQRALKIIDQRGTKAKPMEIKNSIEQMLSDLFMYRKTRTEVTVLHATETIIDKLRETYEKSLSSQQFLFIPSKLAALKNSANAMEQFSSTRLQKEASEGKAIAYRAGSYEKGLEYQLTGNTAYADTKKTKAHVYLFISLFFFRESATRND
jgi:hypothetical protein